MKTFNNRRKVFNPNNNRRSGPGRGSADSPYMPQQGNSNNGYRRNNKNFKDQHTDYLNKAKDAIGNGDEVLEQFYLQHAEHCFRQLDETSKVNASNRDEPENKIVSKKIVKKTIVKKEPKTENSKSETETKTDFDDFASQLA